MKMSYENGSIHSRLKLIIAYWICKCAIHCCVNGNFLWCFTFFCLILCTFFPPRYCRYCCCFCFCFCFHPAPCPRHHSLVAVCFFSRFNLIFPLPYIFLYTTHTPVPYLLLVDGERPGWCLANFPAIRSTLSSFAVSLFSFSVLKSMGHCDTYIHTICTVPLTFNEDLRTRMRSYSFCLSRQPHILLSVPSLSYPDDTVILLAHWYCIFWHKILPNKMVEKA